MDELKIVIAEPFKRRGKARLTPAEFTFALTLELKWLTPEESRQVIDEGLKAGLLKEEKDRIVPAFDYRNVIVPAGYKPGWTSSVERPAGADRQAPGRIGHERSRSSRADQEQAGVPV